MSSDISDALSAFSLKATMASRSVRRWTTSFPKPRNKKKHELSDITQALTTARPPIDATMNADALLPLFERLPAEIRARIFAELLRYGRPFHHRKRLLPFVFARKSQVKKDAL